VVRCCDNLAALVGERVLCHALTAGVDAEPAIFTFLD
jgi:hypothetical protein